VAPAPLTQGAGSQGQPAGQTPACAHKYKTGCQGGGTRRMTICRLSSTAQSVGRTCFAATPPTAQLRWVGPYKSCSSSRAVEIIAKNIVCGCKPTPTHLDGRLLLVVGGVNGVNDRGQLGTREVAVMGQGACTSSKGGKQRAATLDGSVLITKTAPNHQALNYTKTQVQDLLALHTNSIVTPHTSSCNS
jgi:hypothetical protein